MPEFVTLEMPSLPQNTLAVRLLAAGLANLQQFDSEEIEDIKLSVSEACFCSPLVNRKLLLTFVLEENGMAVEIEAGGRLPETKLDFTNPAGEGVGFLLMRKLMDSMEFKSDPKRTFIRLAKRRRSSVAAAVR